MGRNQPGQPTRLDHYRLMLPDRLKFSEGSMRKIGLTLLIAIFFIASSGYTIYVPYVAKSEVTPSTPPGGDTYVDGYGGNIFTAQDTLLNPAGPNINFGQHGVFEISASQRELLRFNLSAIPAGYTCVSATLYLYKTESAGGQNTTHQVYSVAAANAAWKPGTKNGAVGGAGDSTWSYLDQAPSHPIAWAGSAGMSTSGTDYEPTAIGSFTANSGAPAGTEIRISLSPTRIAGWFGTSNTNYGLVIITSSGNLGHVGQSENPNPAYRPKLVVVFQAPSGNSLTSESTLEAPPVSADTAEPSTPAVR
jgi:hypothetical protein